MAILGGIMCAAVPYYFYNKSLETLENGKASILATIEPVIAVMVSVFYYKEPLSVEMCIRDRDSVYKPRHRRRHKGRGAVPKGHTGKLQ